MRKLLLVALVGASARAARSSSRPTTPVHYSCGENTVIRNGIEMRADTAAGNVSHLSWTDDKGEHFVTWPLSPTDRTATEFVVPSDPRQDAQHTYDTTFGSSTADWRLLDKQVCTAHGGPTCSRVTCAASRSTT